MKLILSTLLFFCYSYGFSQENTTVKSGEKLVYAASYNISGLLTQLAQVTMEVQEVKTSKSTMLHLKCTAATFEKWDSFFKIRDLYEAYVNPKTLKPVLYKRDVYEGGYIKKEKYIFNYTKRTVKSSVSKKNGIVKETIVPIDYNTNDVISTLYQLRNMDISKAKPGDKLSLKVIFDNTEKNVAVKYVGKEDIVLKDLGKTTCYKIQLLTQEAKLQGKGENIIYLTADAKKLPALIKFSIPVGSGQLTLISSKGI
ncbi:Protein of unknown function [Arenibacter nanhaiticus]|uniref:DUF3108 domain-containing protein n=1 Tax=Arenibacter nanhaiticus TaxID=558155 RepID=A0A1M6JUN0_9FLAO|nr:DUF3108 domain-containing protein [Arenibacter nanhaiticus]SHJ50376.1 Protein of unknown function [Arenibacter nanhaiticus]